MKHLYIIILIFLFLTGCNTIIETTSIKDVSLNPQDYEGKKITVKGTAGIITIVDEEGYQIRINYDKRLVGKYILTGIFDGNMLKVSEVEEW